MRGSLQQYKIIDFWAIKRAFILRPVVKLFILLYSNPLRNELLHRIANLYLYLTLLVDTETPQGQLKFPLGDKNTFIILVNIMLAAHTDRPLNLICWVLLRKLKYDICISWHIFTLR